MNMHGLYGVAIMLMIAGCAGGDDNTASEGAKEEKALELLPQQVAMAGVKTGHIEYRMISGVINATGEIDVPPEAKAAVTAPSGGSIVESMLLPGMYVKKGQRLAKLTNPEYITLQQEYLETASELQFAEQEYVRQQTLGEQNATAIKKLQQSESTFNTLKGRIAGLKARLEMIGVDIAALNAGNIQPSISIKSPISGYIASANFAQGSYVEAKEVVFEIVNTDDMHVELNVFEQDIAKVLKGQKMRIRAIGSDATYSGTVLLISPQRNADQRTFSVHGHIDEPGKELRTGMFVEAGIFVNSDTVPALPEEAIVYQDTKPCVLVGEGNRFELREVSTGARLDGWIEIMNPGPLLQENIVTEGAARVLAAMKKG